MIIIPLIQIQIIASASQVQHTEKLIYIGTNVICNKQELGSMICIKQEKKGKQMHSCAIIIFM